MGKIASPNTPYCAAFPKGSLSVNGKTFSTENPPISYTIDGATATISDANGVLGTADLTGSLVPVSEQAAIAGTEYCGGNIESELIWNLGSHETSNPPISYQLGTQALLIDDEVTQYPKEISGWTLTPVEGGEIEVDWGGGDIEIISGTSWTQTSGSDWVEIARITFPSNIFCAGSLTRGDTGASEVQDRRWRGYFYNPNTGALVFTSSISNANTRWRVRHAVPQRFLTPPCGAAPGDGWNTVLEWEAATGDIGLSGTSLGSRSIANSNPLPIAVAIMSEYSVWVKVTSNTGAFSLRETTIPPAVSLLSNGCELVVNYSDGTSSSPVVYPECPTVSAVQNTVKVTDSTGAVTTYEYSEVPTNFKVTCYDYDIKKEASYACQGECPAGTKFQCICPESNTLSCYGFDPDNPDIFRSLFTTQIVD